MFITVNQLIEAGIGPTQAKRIHPFLEPALARFQINNPRRASAFLAQCHVESQGYTRLEENLMYTTPLRLVRVWPSRFASEAAAAPFCRNPEGLANKVYAGKIGNGRETSGDGWRYRGRGLKQLTGRANYAAAANAIGKPYIADPGLVQEPEDAVLTAAWFWQNAGCNPVADAGQIDTITRKVNGPAMLEAAQRRRRTAEALRALG
jgi:putative chitinase